MDNGGQHRKGVSDKKQREVKMDEQIEKVNQSLQIIQILSLI